MVFVQWLDMYSVVCNVLQHHTKSSPLESTDMFLVYEQNKSSQPQTSKNTFFGVNSITRFIRKFYLTDQSSDEIKECFSTKLLEMSLKMFKNQGSRVF